MLYLTVLHCSYAVLKREECEGMNFFTVFNQTLILFMLLLVGFIIKRLKIIDEHFNKNLSNLIIYVTLPALIINSMDYDFSVERLGQVGTVFVISIVSYFVMVLLSYLILKFIPVADSERDIYQFILIFANVGFMGYPVIDVIFGSEGVFLAAIYNLIFNLLLWTIGVMIISRSRQEDKGIDWSHLLNPGIFAVFIGFFLFIFSISLPQPISATLEILGSTTTPLSMLVVGAILAQVKLGDIFSNFKLWLISSIRLVGLPLLFLFILKVMPWEINSLIMGIIVVLTGMPAAANTAIFAEEFGGDAALASESVFLTTLLSVLTIPLIVYFL